MNNILEDREKRNKYISNSLSKGNIITIKANIPGTCKNIFYADIIIRYFERKLEKIISNIIAKEIIYSFDGKYIIYIVDKHKNYKEELIKLEEEDDFGRLVDLDFYTNAKSNSRGYLRKCILCEESAFVCIRKQKHKAEEIINYSKKIVLDKLKEELKSLLKESMLEELNLHPKFGLVTPLSNGSHFDMNYDIMKSSIDTIVNGLLEMFEIGYSNEKENYKEIYSKIKVIGVNTEKAMFKETQGINTYQGLIFNLGILVASLGYTFKTNISLDNIFTNASLIASDVTKEYVTSSFGSKAYHELNFGGARAEAYLGFPTVKKIYNYLSRYESLNYDNLIKALVLAIIESEDTVFLKRAKSYQRYQEIKAMFKSITYQQEEIEELTSKMIEENISFGGSADILICAIFIYKLNAIFKLENE